MPVRQYPFIDIAVHARVREHFARGDASVLFSKDLARVLWANDQGAKLFGVASVYDFIDSALAGDEMVRAAAPAMTAAPARLAMDRISISVSPCRGAATVHPACFSVNYCVHSR